MSKKLHVPIEGELPLFINGTEETGYHTWQTIEEFPALPEVPIMDPSSPSNDVDVRYFHIERALMNLGKSSQRRGFKHAVKIEPHSSQIWGEYKGITPVVIEGATRNIDRFEKSAKNDFDRSTGFIALLGAKMITREEARKRADTMWDNFYFRFAGSANLKRREQFKKVIKAHNKSIKKRAA